MKRYMVFAGSVYYPDGGAHDFFDSFDTEGEANDKALGLSSEESWGAWGHVFDCESGMVIAKYIDGEKK